MPYEVRENHADCPSDKPYACVNSDTGEVKGCHATRDEAQQQVEALYENEPEAKDESSVDAELPSRFDAQLIFEGTRTTDGREFEVGGIEHRPLPLPLMYQTEEPEMGGHANSVLAGNIESIRIDDGVVFGNGSFDLGSEAGRELARLVKEQRLRWVSGDMEPLEYEVYEEGDCEDMFLLFHAEGEDEVDEEDDGKRVLYSEGGEDDCTMVLHVTRARLMGATVVPFPAFPGAQIVPEGEAFPDDIVAAASVARPFRRPPSDRDALAAAAIPVEPPVDWFDDPKLSGATPLTIEDSGRVFGHAALWGTCHIGRGDACLTPPRSEADYRYFATGATKVSGDCDCDKIPSGVITIGTGHASLSEGYRGATEHYDHTGHAVADVSVGEDEHGIWVAGALRPGVTPEQVRELRGSALSGDWRRIGTSLELVALLAVNVPGFPVPRARVASADGETGEQTALVAGGAVPAEAKDRSEVVLSRLSARLDRVERMLKPLAPTIRDNLLARIRA